MNQPEQQEVEEEYDCPVCDVCGGQFEDVLDGICGECDSYQEEEE
jgi:hypothetical protein